MAERPPQETLRSPKADFAALVAANALLAMGPLFVRIADVGPVASAFWRMALALPILVLLATRGGMPRMSRGLVVVLILSGVLFAADLASWHLGILRTKLANATLFGNSTSLLFPIYGFLIARARETLSALPLLALSTLASAVPLLILAIAMGERVVPVDWTPLIGLALCSQVLGQGLMVYVLGRLSPLVIGLGLLTQPVVAAVIGWGIFNEHLGMADMIGAVLVGLALVLVRQPEVKAA